MDDELDLAGFLDDVRSEADEHLQVLDTQLLLLERDPADPRPLRHMFLSAHTIKGCAAMVELTDVAALAHAMEDVLATLRDEGRPLDTVTADLLFQGLDVLRVLVARSVPGVPLAGMPTADLVARLRVQARQGREQTPGPATVPAAAAAATRRVLLVEDSPTVRMLETILLTEAGFEVEAVADGTQALALALARRYNLLVTGVETRGLRGPDLAAALRATPEGRALPIIMMSSDEDAVARQRSADAEVQAYIRKGTFGQRRLIETARELVP